MANIPSIPIAAGPPPELLPTPPPSLPPQPMVIDGVTPDPVTPAPIDPYAQFLGEQTPFVDEFAGAPAPAPALAPPPEWPPKSWGEQPPQPEGPPAPPATQQAGQQGMAALDQARQEGPGIQPAYDAKGNPIGGPGKPPAQPKQQPQGTGDPYLDYLGHSADNHSQALLAQSKAEKDKNDFMASEGARIASDANKRQAAADKMYMDAYQEGKAKRAILDKEAMAIANQEIDPKRAWNNMSFGAQLFVAVTAGLMAATDRSMKTGQNSVLDAVNAMAKQDMEAQQMNIANRQNALGMRRGLLADDLAAGRDLLDFQYKSINAAYEMATNEIKAYALKYDNPIINAKAAEELQKIQDARVAMGMEYETKKRKEALDREESRAQRSIAAKNAETARMNVLSEIEDRKARREAAEKEAALGNKSVTGQRLDFDIKKDKRERVIQGLTSKDGKQLYAARAEDATKVRTKMGAATKGVAAIDELTEIYKKHGWQPMGKWSGGEKGADYQRAYTLTQDVMTSFSLEKGQGTIRDGEYDRYEEMIGKPGGWIDPTEGSLAQMRETFVNDVNDDLGPSTSLDEDDNIVEPQFWLPKAHLKKPDPNKEAKGNRQGWAQEPVEYDKDGHPIVRKPDMNPYRVVQGETNIDAIPIGPMGDIPLDNSGQVPPGLRPYDITVE